MEESPESILEPEVPERQSRVVWTPLAWAALLLALTPVCQLVAFLGFVALARWQNGHWPRHGDRDPHIFGWSPYMVVGLGLMGWWIGTILAILLAGFVHKRRPDFPIRVIIPIAILAALFMSVYLGNDPGGFLNWFWD
jgi:ABC-type Fe3+ transport system permease subunit